MEFSIPLFVSVLIAVFQHRLGRPHLELALPEPAVGEHATLARRISAEVPHFTLRFIELLREI